MSQLSARPLGAATLTACADRVEVPGYDRSALKVGIVHFGVGGFHRAHQAMFLDRLMNAGQAHDWAICGVGVMPSDRRIKEALEAQDHLYTLVEKHADGTYEARVIGSIVDFLFAPDNPEAVIERLADEATRIVSLTVTEGGYSIDDVTGDFDARPAEIAADLEHSAPPTTVFGLVCEALRRRRQRGTPPFTVVSCDNLPGNGTVAGKAFTSFARMLDSDSEFGEWMEQCVRFPNSMVDRITPGTTDDDREAVRERFGIEDRWPVVCEPFVQWVLEDSFTLGRPPYEDAGVQVVSDVEPYELMKLRLLNISHQGLAYFGRLCDYELVHQAAQDPLFQRFLRGYMDAEATPTLAPVPDVDLADYKDTLIERFSNPEIRDTIARLCAESSDRIPKWLLPVVRAQLADDGEIRHSAAIVASWARYAEGADEHGEPIEVVDRQRDRVMALAAEQRDEPLAFISDRELFGDLADQPRFGEAFAGWLESLHEHGARATLQTVVDQD